MFYNINNYVYYIIIFYYNKKSFSEIGKCITNLEVHNCVRIPVEYICYLYINICMNLYIHISVYVYVDVCVY